MTRIHARILRTALLCLLPLTACVGELGDANGGSVGARGDGDGPRAQAVNGDGDGQSPLGSRPGQDGRPPDPDPQTQPPRFSCSEPEPARGFNGPSMRRLTRAELLSTIGSVVGDDVMAAAEVTRATDRIPLEPPGDIVMTFQNGHARDHVEGLLLTAEAIAAEVAQRADVRDRLLGACAASADRECAEAFLTGPALRFTRRPLGRERLDAMLSAFEAEGSGLAGMQWLLARVLQAPEVVFHLEQPRKMCDAGPLPTPMELSFDDESVFFAPNGAPRTGPLVSLSSAGWYVWEIPAERIDVGYQQVRIALSVAGPAGAEAQVSINVNDNPLQHGLVYAVGDHTFEGTVEVPPGEQLKVGVYFANGGTGPSLALRSLTLLAQQPPIACRDAAGQDGVFAVDAFTVAARLAFALTGRGPDAELLAAAEADGLSTLDEVMVHAERLLNSLAARGQFSALVRAWLDLDALPTPHAVLAEGAGIEPEGLPEEAAQELLDYVLYEVFDRGADVSSLMSDAVGFPRSQRMATLYRSEVASGDEPVALEAGHGGLLLRIAPLLSGQLSSSPILRGVYVRKRVLCDVLPSPDFTIVNSRLEQFEHEDRTRLSTREAVTEITAAPTCQSCHVQINPLGFALEPFGPLGMPRSEEIVYDHDGVEIARHPIDAVVDDPALETGGPTRLSGPTELSDALASSAKVRGCLASRLYNYARLRPQSDADACMLSRIEETLRDGGTVRDAWLHAVVNEQLLLREEAAP